MTNARASSLNATDAPPRPQGGLPASPGHRCSSAGRQGDGGRGRHAVRERRAHRAALRHESRRGRPATAHSVLISNRTMEASHPNWNCVRVLRIHNALLSATRVCVRVRSLCQIASECFGRRCGIGRGAALRRSHLLGSRTAADYGSTAAVAPLSRERCTFSARRPVGSDCTWQPSSLAVIPNHDSAAAKDACSNPSAVAAH